MMGTKTRTGIGSREREGGVIINVASLLGLKGGRGSAGYVASKAGVIGEFPFLSFLVLVCRWRWEGLGD